jgi:uncharacterized membrane protein YidH (DUF202 family)
MVRQRTAGDSTTSNVTQGAGKEETAHNTISLARFRTQLALDRTTLAWIRTTLTLVTFGFGMAVSSGLSGTNTKAPK